MFKKKGYSLSYYRFSVVAIVVALLALSCVLLQRLQGGETQVMLKQIAGILLGLFVMVMVSLVDYHFICKFFIPLYLFNILLMFICKYVTYSMFPLVYGWKHYEAKRWIKIGGHGQAGSGFEFMPSEISKLILIIFMAKLFCLLEKRINTVLGLLVIVITVGIPIFLVFDQPDLSTGQEQTHFHKVTRCTRNVAHEHAVFAQKGIHEARLARIRRAVEHGQREPAERSLPVKTV